MQVHTLDKAGVISELHFGQGISQAVTHGRRADFALLLACSLMMSVIIHQ